MDSRFRGNDDIPAGTPNIVIPAKAGIQFYCLSYWKKLRESLRRAKSGCTAACNYHLGIPRPASAGSLRGGGKSA
jgi:hypothetical protein